MDSPSVICSNKRGTINVSYFEYDCPLVLAHTAFDIYNIMKAEARGLERKEK